jgi:hypothetical protein
LDARPSLPGAHIPTGPFFNDDRTFHSLVKPDILTY